MQELQNNLDRVFRELINALNNLDDTELNQVPFNGSWTPAQVGQHLLKSYQVLGVLADHCTPADRPADAHVPLLHKIFLDHSQKFESPADLRPDARPLPRQELIGALNGITAQLSRFAASEDLSLLCKGYKLPHFGELTRLEWLHFMYVHTERHLQQLRSMRAAAVNETGRHITIREALIEELPLLRTFEQGIVAAERPFDPTLKDGQIEYYDLGAMIRADHACVLVAETDGRLIAGGYALLKDARTYQRFPQYAHLGFMFVEPEYRGRGLNGQLIDHLVNWAKNKGITEVRLQVYAGNDPAIRAYEKVGFKPHLLTMRLDP